MEKCRTSGKQSLRHAVQIVYLNLSKTIALCVSPLTLSFLFPTQGLQSTSTLFLFSFFPSSLYLSLSSDIPAMSVDAGLGYPTMNLKLNQPIPSQHPGRRPTIDGYYLTGRPCWVPGR